MVELDRTGRSVDADLSLLPGDVVDDILDAFVAFADSEVSIIHGDPVRCNLRIASDGRVRLLDWDESRVDLVALDLANLGVQVLGDSEHANTLALADAWEAANAWAAEPDYARGRLAGLRARRPTR